MSIYQKDIITIAAMAALMFVPFLGAVHLFDWDEINFAECAREMLVTGDYFRVHINFLPFWEKPPLFFWLQAAAMHLFGVSEFAARLPNAVCGMITLPVLYAIGVQLHSRNFGLVWSLVYGGSILPHFYFHSGIIDPWLNLFIFLGVYFFYRFHKAPDTGRKWVWLSGLFIGLGLITKGPVALIIFTLVFGIHWAVQRFKWYFSSLNILQFILTVLLVSMLWYGFEVYKNGFWFLVEFIRYNYRLFSTPDAGHGGFFGYHVVVLLVGCFPASFFYLNYLLKHKKYSDYSGFSLWMLILFFVVLILFSIVKSKIVHYSSLCYFPLTYGASWFIYNHLQNNQNWAPFLKWSVIVFLILVGFLLIVFPFLVQEKTILTQMLSKDPFAAANMEAEVSWSGIEWTVGLLAFGIAVAWWYFNNLSALNSAVYTLFGGVSLLVICILYAFIGRIEQFTQGANIAFFKSIANEDAYVVTVGYRSYAHYFYGAVRPENSPKDFKLEAGDTWGHKWRHTLLYEHNSKPIYISAKINSRSELMSIPGVEIIKEQNGWIFAKKAAME
jgi:4-amino-4-deoxy-L-arabinose transferase-like glycosyltransferase